MRRAEGHYLQVFASELGGHGKLLPAAPAFALSVLGHHGRVVRHLLGHRPPPEVGHSITLVSLPQQGVERLAGAAAGGGVTRDGERRHHGQLLTRVGALGRLVQNVCVLVVLGQALQHRQRLGEIHLKL